jgi:hypothetical protein
MKTLILAALVVLGLSSCATDRGTATPGYFRPGYPGDGVSQLGVFIVPKLPEVVTEK